MTSVSFIMIVNAFTPSIPAASCRFFRKLPERPRLSRLLPTISYFIAISVLLQDINRMDFSAAFSRGIFVLKTSAHLQHIYFTGSEKTQKCTNKNTQNRNTNRNTQNANSEGAYRSFKSIRSFMPARCPMDHTSLFNFLFVFHFCPCVFLLLSVPCVL